jgi:SPP1 gp7 family putative phage head morphogenesis protein
MPKQQNNSSELARLLYNGKISPSDIDAESVRLLATELMNGALGGYGKPFKDLEPESIDYQILSKIEDNIHVFSGAKNFAQLQEMSALLLDENGKLVPFNKYALAVKAIDKTYNKNYLAAEYDLALQSAQQAEHWQRIQEEKDLFPFLQYNAILDGHETQLCNSLDGIIKPVDDPFWNTRFPPNHWRCRSVVDPLADDENDTTETPKDLPNLPDMFNNNVGKNGEIFPPSAPYFKLPGNEAKTVKQKIDYLIPHRWENFKKYEALKLDKNYNNVEFNSESGGFRASHLKQSISEIEGNEIIADELMNNGFGVQLLENIENIKSADAFLNNKGIWEFKFLKANTSNAIQQNVLAGRKQAANIVIRLPKKLPANLISKALNNSIKFEGTQAIEKVMILLNKKYVIITRREILSNRALQVLQNFIK